MRYNIINPNFSEIREIRYGTKILRKAGSSEVSGPDFLETDMKYLQDKIEFSSSRTLNYLDEYDKTEIIGGDVGKLEKYYLTFFPSIITGETDEGDINYFSTYIDYLGTETLVVFIPAYSSTIKMYEDSGDTEESIEVMFDLPESPFSKVLFMVTSYSSESPRTVNLSYLAYTGDKSPNKKMSDYVLRNDDLVENYKGTRIREDGFLYSEISGFILGTKKLSIEVDRPIYFLRSRSVNDNWSRTKRYGIGDTARVGNTLYESLEAGNIGNHPYYSRSWVKL